MSDFEADFEYLEDEELSANPAVNNIVSSYGTSTYGGLSIPELASSNFNGQILRVIDAQTATQATLGMSLYLNSSNIPLAPPTSTPLDSDIAYQIVEKTTLSGNTTFSVIKDGAVLQLDPIPSGNNIYLLRENWSGTTDFGDSGWAITAEGNSVFNNVRVRGNIEATSGFFGSSENSGWSIGSNSLFGKFIKNKLSSYDPSFEQNWENFWTLLSPPTGFLLSISNPKQDGNWSAAIQNFGSSGNYSYSLETFVLPIQSSVGNHTLSFYASATNSGHTMNILVSYYDNSGSLINTESKTASITTTFQPKSVSLSLPIGTEYVKISLSSSTTFFTSSLSYLLIIDAIQLEAGTSATSFNISSYIGLVPSEDIKIKVAASETSTPVFSVNSSGAITASGITSSGNVSSSRIRATSTSGVTTTSTLHAFQIGPNSGINMRFDANEIQVVNNGSASGISINTDGGNVVLGDVSSLVRLSNGTSTSNHGEVESGAIYYDTSSSAGSAVHVYATSHLLKRFTSTYNVKDNISKISDYSEISPIVPSEKVKNNILFDPKNILLVTPVAFNPIGTLDNPNKVEIGFIAEDIADKIPELAVYGDDDAVDFYNIYGIVASMLAVIQEQEIKINELEERLAILEG